MPAVIQTQDEPPPVTRLAGSLRDVPIAPTLDVPDKRIISVEHPCIVRSLDKGLRSMGGEPRMKHMLDHHVGDSLVNPSKPRPEPEVGISLRPDDPFAAKLTSTGVQTRNVLVKVTIPKRTGRKRKRGSDEPFEHHSPSDQPTSSPSCSSITAAELLTRLRDNENDYVIEPVGMVSETHRFRSLPDFQMRAGDIPIYQEISSHLLPSTWSSLKSFKLDPTVGIPVMPAFPAPPTFAASGQPYRYEYQQAAGVRFKRDEDGKVSSLNMQTAPRKLVLPVAADVKEVPQAPPIELTANHPTGALLPEIVQRLQALLDERPLLTTRVALNYLPDCGDTIYREATQWVGYNFKSGPFRDTLVKYGVDPRTDPKYRIYQTLMFQLDKRATRATGDKAGRWNRTMRHVANAEDIEKRSHMFDGKHVSLNGKVWQICDITDPLLKRILDTPDIPTECDISGFGWFHDGTLCKARVIMREKMDALVEGREVEESLYELVATMPDRIDDFPVDRTSAYFGTSSLAGRANALAGDVRNMAKGGIKGHLSRMKKVWAYEAAARAGSVVSENGLQSHGGVETNEADEPVDGEQADDANDTDDGEEDDTPADMRPSSTPVDT